LPENRHGAPKQPVNSARREGIDFAVTCDVLHLDGAGPDTPRLPARRLVPPAPIAASAVVHAAGAVALVLLFGRPVPPARDAWRTPAIEEQPCVDAAHIVFLARDPRPASGGGGGGNRTAGPIRRAEGIGSDAMTLRTRTSRPAVTPSPVDEPSLPSITLDAVPMAMGTVEQLGLPSTGVVGAASTGTGSGGGVGSGRGTGIGSGDGPGLGPGSGGGTGGGVFRAGGSVTAPRVLVEVRPKYTSDALRRHIQGTVELEVVVTRDGLPSRIRMVRSLDPGGLDDEAIVAVTGWRFEPGRNAGTPVDVLVTVLLDFWIR
jgi:TonB family protein